MAPTSPLEPDGAGGLRLDALPPEMAARAEDAGVRWPAPFIAVGAVYATTVTAGAAGVVPYGLARLLAGVVFCLATTDRVLAILFPISAFVAAGFEHSVANMYFIPIALFIRAFAPLEFWDGIGQTTAPYDALTWGAAVWRNWLPVTIGHIIGGVAMVAAVYWFIYLRAGRQSWGPAAPR